MSTTLNTPDIKTTTYYRWDPTTSAYTDEVRETIDYYDYGVIATEAYNGRTISVSYSGRLTTVFDARDGVTTRWGSHLNWSADDWGRSAPLSSGTTVPGETPSPKRIAAAFKAAKASIDRYEEDEALRPRLTRLVSEGEQWEASRPPLTVPAEGYAEVGDIARLYSRGKYRYGVVTKVGPKRVEIAYLTRGGLDGEKRGYGKASITRKAQPISGVLVVARPSSLMSA